MKVFVLAPIYNRKNVTLSFLRSFSKQTYANYQMVIVDDGSTDGSSEAIMTEFPNTIILKGDGNLWWTGAMRMGVKHILTIANNDDYIIAINDDVIVKDDYIEKILSISKEDKNAIVGSIYLDEQENEIVYDSGVKIDWKRYSYYQLPYNTQKKILEADTLSTRGALIPVAVFKKIGSFEKKLRHYAADYEFFFRAKKAGYKLLISKEVVVYGSERDRLERDESRIQPLSAIWKRNFSIKSPVNIYNHFFLIWHYCPSIYYKLKHSLLILAYNGFLFFNSIFFYLFKSFFVKYNKNK